MHKIEALWLPQVHRGRFFWNPMLLAGLTTVKLCTLHDYYGQTHGRNQLLNPLCICTRGVFVLVLLPKY